MGGRFLYQEGIVKGVKKPDSGYRHDVKYKVMKDGKHPITKGIDDFEIIDELYLAEIFEDDINPILRSDYEFVDKNFYSAARALEGEMFSTEIGPIKMVVTLLGGQKIMKTVQLLIYNLVTAHHHIVMKTSEN